MPLQSALIFPSPVPLLPPQSNLLSTPFIQFLLIFVCVPRIASNNNSCTGFNSSKLSLVLVCCLHLMFLVNVPICFWDNKPISFFDIIKFCFWFITVTCVHSWGAKLWSASRSHCQNSPRIECQVASENCRLPCKLHSWYKSDTLFIEPLSRKGTGRAINRRWGGLIRHKVKVKISIFYCRLNQHKAFPPSPWISDTVRDALGPKGEKRQPQSRTCAQGSGYQRNLKDHRTLICICPLPANKLGCNQTIILSGLGVFTSQQGLSITPLKPLYSFLGGRWVDVIVPHSLAIIDHKDPIWVRRVGRSLWPLLWETIKGRNWKIST